MSSRLTAGTPMMYYINDISVNDGKFELDTTNGVLSTVDDPQFDYETQTDYAIEIVATNGIGTGDAKYTVSVTVTVYITDYNEAPVIQNLPTSVEFVENQENSFKVLSKDPDKGDEHLELKYSIVYVWPVAGTDIFSIAQVKTMGVEPGTVSSTAALNYEEHDQYKLTICVEDQDPVPADGGVSGLTDCEVLHIEVKNVNERPYFTNTHREYIAKIYEESPIGLLLPIPPLTAVDPDFNDTVTYELEGRDHTFFDIKTINGSGYIYLRRRLDREEKEPYIGPDHQFELYVVARDREEYPTRYNKLSGSNNNANSVCGDDVDKDSDCIKIIVEVWDINDHLPVCDPLYYNATITENTPAHTSILTISCNDLDRYHLVYTVDGSELAERSFEVLRADDGVFPGDSRGILYVKDHADFERTGTITFYVYATEGITPGPTSTNVTVVINVTALNDHRPEFTKSFWNFEVRYDAPTATSVGRVVAIDFDIPNAALSYDWVSMIKLFHLGTQTGLITVKESLADNKRYLYFVVANDNQDPVTYSEHAAVRIDTFSPENFLVDFEIEQPLSYFTDERIDEFEAAISSACPPCLGRVSSLKSKDSQRTIVTAYALTDDTTESKDNVNVIKTYINKADLLRTFTINEAGDPSKAASLSGFHNFPVVKVTNHQMSGMTALQWLLYTPGGNAVLALLSLLAAALITWAIVALIRSGILNGLCKSCKNCKCPDCDCCKRSKPEKHLVKTPDGLAETFDFRYTDAPLVPDVPDGHLGKVA